ncbi:POL1 protein, partial [Bombycilla garrulus]|nr:POL1 protein [Bombycilla garrulus]
LQPPPSQMADQPLEGRVLYTDASSATNTAAVVWEEGGQWQKVTVTLADLSVQSLEARAMEIALQIFPEEPCNIVTDSQFVASLMRKMFLPGWAGTPLAIRLHAALQQRRAPCFVIKVASHTPTDKGLFLGNRKADEAAKGIWTLSEAQRLHRELHLGAKALAQTCKIPLPQARQVVATCPCCQS